jgi:hypothetical protein
VSLPAPAPLPVFYRHASFAAALGARRRLAANLHLCPAGTFVYHTGSHCCTKPTGASGSAIAYESTSCGGGSAAEYVECPAGGVDGACARDLAHLRSMAGRLAATAAADVRRVCRACNGGAAHGCLCTARLCGACADAWAGRGDPSAAPPTSPAVNDKYPPRFIF